MPFLLFPPYIGRLLCPPGGLRTGYAAGADPGSTPQIQTGPRVGGLAIVMVAGNLAYLYRAVDSTGETIEFILSPKRDLIAAKLFLRLALFRGGPGPLVIN